MSTKVRLKSWFDEKVTYFKYLLIKNLLNTTEISIALNIDKSRCREIIEKSLNEFIETWGDVLNQDPDKEAEKFCSKYSRGNYVECFEELRRWYRGIKDGLNKLVNNWRSRIDEIVNELCSDEKINKIKTKIKEYLLETQNELLNWLTTEIELRLT